MSIDRKKEKAQIVIFASTAWYVALACAFLFVPAFDKLFGLDESAARVLAGILFMMGLFYLLIIPNIFRILEARDMP